MSNFLKLLYVISVFLILIFIINSITFSQENYKKKVKQDIEKNQLMLVNNIDIKKLKNHNNTLSKKADFKEKEQFKNRQIHNDKYTFLAKENVFFENGIYRKESDNQPLIILLNEDDFPIYTKNAIITYSGIYYKDELSNEDIIDGNLILLNNNIIDYNALSINDYEEGENYIVTSNNIYKKEDLYESTDFLITEELLKKLNIKNSHISDDFYEGKEFIILNNKFFYKKGFYFSDIHDSFDKEEVFE